MKKKFIYTLVFLSFSFFWVGCAQKVTVKEGIAQDYQQSIRRKDTEDSVVFQGRVLEVSTLLVEPIEGSLERNSSDQIHVSVDYDEIYWESGEKATLENIEVGDIIEVEYDGVILEIYPARIRANKIIIRNDHSSQEDKEKLSQELEENTTELSEKKEMKEEKSKDLSLWEDIYMLEDVSFNIDRVENGVIAFTIENNTQKEIVFGSDYFLLKEINGEWEKVNTESKDFAFTSEAYNLMKNIPFEAEVNYTYIYGQLDQGTYQLVKSVLDFRGPSDYSTYYIGDIFVIQ